MDEPLVVEEANPDWPAWFATIVAYVGAEHEPAIRRVEHVGSTSVATLAAKPIIDVDVVVANAADRPAAFAFLESRGYRGVGDLGVEDRDAFEAPADASLPAQHLYLVVEGTRPYLDHWLFRDALRDDAAYRERYATLKRANVVLAKGDGDYYTALKADFVAEVLTVARAARGLAPVAYWRPEVPR